MNENTLWERVGSITSYPGFSDFLRGRDYPCINFCFIISFAILSALQAVVHEEETLINGTELQYQWEVSIQYPFIDLFIISNEINMLLIG